MCTYNIVNNIYIVICVLLEKMHRIHTYFILTTFQFVLKCIPKTSLFLATLELGGLKSVVTTGRKIKKVMVLYQDSSNSISYWAHMSKYKENWTGCSLMEQG